MKLGQLKAALSIATLVLSAGAGATVISNTAVTGTIGTFGSPNTATYGQTFTVGADTVLDNFTMYLNRSSGAINLRGYLAGWDGAKATDILYTSTTRTMNAASSGEFSFDTGGLNLVTGAKYVMFLSVSGLGAQQAASFTMPSTGDSYAGGNFTYMNNGLDFSLLTTRAWACPNGCNDWGDAAFKAQLSKAAVVPEPASMALLGLGLMGLVAARRKR